MSSTTIWHNPRCSKSRQTLALLEEKGIVPEVVLYLQDAPTEEDILDVLEKLGIEARQLMRRNESIYKELNLADVEEQSVLIKAMAENPKLVERPVVLHGGKAALGRPPESVLDLF